MKFPVKVVLEKIKENKVTHEKELCQAKENYKKKLIDVLSSALEKAKSKEGLKTSLSALSLPWAPPNHLTDYDRVISMLELTSETSVELTQKEYSQFVLDNWEWKEEFRNISSSYLSNSNE